MTSYQQYFVSRETQEVNVDINGKIIKFVIRKLPWSLRNKIISNSVTYDTKGNINFDGDHYYRECLKYMIVEAPWGVTNDIVLQQIDDDLGAALEALVPKAFNAASINVQTVDSIKKG